MSVSVVIASRNRELIKERAVSSAYGAAVVIVDDCSDVPYSEGAFRLIRNTEHRGLAYSRNIGASSAETEYIVHLDDDNELLPGFLEQAVAYLDSHPEEAAVAVGKVITYPEGDVYQPPVTEGSMNDGFLMRREAFLDIQCDETLTANEDADFGIRFREKYKIGAIHKPLFHAYASPIFNTTSYSDYSNYHLEGLVRFWLKHKDDQDAPYFKKYIGRMFLLASGQMRWFRWGYWIQEKLKRYYQIYLA